MAKGYVIRDSLTGSDIKNIREILSMTQKEFADFANCSVRTVENWESKAERITGPIVTLIEILLRKPEYAKKLTLPKDRLKVRLYYMFGNMVCTIIDVDELSKEVIIHNYIDDPIYRAFGVNTEPDFADYEEFLESRCFPRTRDKIKLELKRLDIPFYDPMMIIEKTGGRMADDDFWIKIER
ncbi:MAG: transcriptional regulator [Lachnospiraceae bacterium]|nr:transcriptional regulator [Lachnospiraceae bacterium]